MRVRLLCVSAAAAFALGTPAVADVPPGPGRDFNQHLDTVTDASKEKAKEKKKSRDILIVPVPHSSPSPGSGLTLVGVFVIFTVGMPHLQKVITQ